ncbi:hypothetical protein MLD38_040061 [Melastoma candidum]|uniref:Uncharacterized protein n=1 Tax=Melastoma candidum TaxID=119954 RepID=A0ACB9L440_9MYRT|nr:hypothetical protein MLD38_040061 [Melastoma candidum]
MRRHKKCNGPSFLWTFSISLEAVAMLPQLVLLQRTRNIDNLTGQKYAFFLGLDFWDRAEPPVCHFFYYYYYFQSWKNPQKAGTISLVGRPIIFICSLLRVEKAA